MDLIRRAPNGRLDALAACRLLWCGALSFDDSCVSWDGTTHYVTAPTINNDVISLYGVPHDEAASVVEDVLDLLNELAQDEELRVPDTQIADGVRTALAAEHLSGASLFLLQCGTHPLVVDQAGKGRIQVRYDQRLARGIPHLQDLLCRMLCHLQSFCDNTEPFTVLFAENNASHGTTRTEGLQDFEGCVEGGCQRLDAQVKVTNELASEHEEASTAPAADSHEHQRLIDTLESDARVTRALIDTMQERITKLEETHAKEEQAGVDPSAKARFEKAAPRAGLFGGSQASRTLITRSIVYVIIGALIMWLGRCCLVDGQAISAQLARMCEQALSLASTWINLIFMKMNQVGAEAHISIAPDLFVDVLRIVGFVLMGLGIIIPVRKILKLRRRLSRRISFSSSHDSYIAELAEKQRLGAEADYAEALDTWATRLQQLEIDTDLARDSLVRLENADKGAQEALVALGVTPADPADELKVSRSENVLLKSIRTAHSEEQRHQLIADHCEQMEKSIELALRAM